MKKVLLTEDDQFKLQHLRKQLLELEKDSIVVEARSVNSAMRALSADPSFDCVILDMSLPTYDIRPNEPGGQPQGFGGRNVMHYMQNEDLLVPVIVVTQFERFGEAGKEVDLNTLNAQLSASFPALFRGLVYYNAASDKWRQELAVLWSRLSNRDEADA